MAEQTKGVQWSWGDLSKTPTVGFNVFVGYPGTQKPSVGGLYADIKADEKPIFYGKEFILEPPPLTIEGVLPWGKVTGTPYSSPGSARPFASPNYQAALRRGRCVSLAKVLAVLERRAAEEDFVVYTHPVTDGLRTLLGELAESPSEGNTREILRRLRDTFLDGGWNHYREKKARQIASEVLIFLGRAERVTPEHADRFLDLMLEGGLKPMGMPLINFTNDDDDEEDEEDQILD